MPKLFKFSFLPSSRMIPVALAPVREIASLYFTEQNTVERVALALEEAISNITEYCGSNTLTEITVEAELENEALVLSVTDRGIPGDLDVVLTDEQKLGLSLMRGMMDRVEIENLGESGRRQVLTKFVKFIEEKPDFTQRASADPPACEPDVHLTIRPVREEETYEVARCIYDEFGFSYPTIAVYYPERFYAAIQRGEIYSLVAVTDGGEIAAHLALSRWDSLPGIWEMGMGVVKHRFRNVHVMGKMTEMIRAYAKDSLGLACLICEPVLYHPYTQKIAGKQYFHACGAGLSYVPADFVNTINNGGGRQSVAIAMAVFRRDKGSLYLPNELRPLVLDIVDRMELDRVSCDSELPPLCEESVVQAVAHPTYGIGRITFYHIGCDFEQRLHDMIPNLRRQSVLVIELFMNASEPGFGMAYAAAKREGFFCTGLLPQTGAGDMIMMQNLFEQTVDYTSFVTVEPFTTLINNIRALDPEQRKGQQHD